MSGSAKVVNLNAFEEKAANARNLYGIHLDRIYKKSISKVERNIFPPLVINKPKYLKSHCKKRNVFFQEDLESNEVLYTSLCESDDVHLLLLNQDLLNNLS